jgi:UTP--glucose-1-phosphate uridylyltransferase
VEIQQALITAASKSQRHLPLQTLVDQDGIAKTALQILVEEVLQTGIEQIVVVVTPGDIPAYEQAAGGLSGRLTFLEQAQPLGYGHAVWSARSALEERCFLLLVGDHLYVSGGAQRCAQQLTAVARSERCAISAVQSTHESKLPLYGTVGGRLVAGRSGLYEIFDVIEKPSPTVAEQRLIVPGLRSGNYLCFFGMHVLTPTVLQLLEEDVHAAGGRGNVHLTPALARLAARERYLAAELEGSRYDVGLKYGMLTAQLALALHGQDRDQILAGLVELLARREV